MSIKVMSRVWQNSALKGSERLALLALADCANDEGECFPSLSTVAKKVNCTIPRVCKILASIELTGELKRQRSSGGFNKRTHYKITVAENSIPRNSVAENSIPEGKRALSPATDAINSHRTVNKAGRRKRSLLNRESDLRVTELIRYFAAEYEKRFKRSYHVAGGKDGKLVKALLRTFDLPTLKLCALALLDSEDDFLCQTDKGIGILSNQINKLAGMIANGAGRRDAAPTRALPDALDYGESPHA